VGIIAQFYVLGITLLPCRRRKMSWYINQQTYTGLTVPIKSNSTMVPEFNCGKSFSKNDCTIALRVEFDLRETWRNKFISKTILYTYVESLMCSRSCMIS
jgi:hypothetical protein